MHRTDPLRSCLALFALMAFLSLAGCALRGAGHGVAMRGDAYDADIVAVLAKAGDNAPELRAFLGGLEPGTERAEAGRFLVAGLPLRDAAVMTARDLAENVDFALRARERFPWCATLPWNEFLRFVVPHRVAQEPAHPWRQRLYETLRPEVLGLDSASSVVEIVNRWVLGQAGYAPTARWDQGALQTMARGLGRCEELTVLLVDALRAVGVAARPCGVSWWRHADDNHVWVEFLDHGRWRYVGAGDVDSRPDLTWFTPWLHAQAGVWSVAYGAHGPGVPGLRAGKRGSALVDRTADYVRAGTLDVALTDAHGEPAPGAVVYVSVYNSGALRTDTARRTGPDGRCSFSLGAGDYLLTARPGGAGAPVAHAFASVAAGERGSVRLRSDAPDATPDATLETARWMRFPVDAPLAARLQGEVDALRRERAPLKEAIEAARTAELDGYEVLTAACLGVDSMDDPLMDTPLAKAMLATGRNVFELVKAWVGSWVLAGEEGRTVLSALLVTMHPKDLAAFRGRPLAADALAALEAMRAVEDKGWYAAMDPAEYARAVLPSRVRHEAFTHWRAPLWERYGAWLADAATPMDLARRVNRLAAAPEAVERFRLAPDMDPLAVLRCGHVSSARDRAVLAVALLRGLGVPARYVAAPPGEKDWAEFHDGHAWRPLYPADPAGLGDPSAARAARARYADPARLAVRFIRHGRALDADAVRYWRDVTLCRFTDDGALEVEREPDASWEDGRAVFSVPPGRWLLVSGTRGPGGQPFVRVETLDLRAGERRDVERAMDVEGAP